NNIKIAFIDLDGTLLNDHHKLSKLNLESLSKTHNKGIKIVFATGRPPYSVSYTIGKDVKQNNLSLMPGIYLDGSIAYGPNGERIIDNYIDEKLLMDIFNFSKEKNILRCVYWYRSENIHTVEMDEYTDQSNYEVLVRDKNGNPVDKNNLKNNIKIAFIDLDGTLLNDHHKLSKLNLESLSKTHNKGIKIVFATGRPPYSVSYTIGKDVKQNNLSLMPGIYLDGSIAYGPNGERIIDNYIDEKLLMDIFNFSKEKNILRCVYWYRSENIHTVEMDEYSDEDLNILPIVPNIIDEETLKNTKIHKILIRINEQSLSSVLKMYQDKFSDRIYVGKRSKRCVELSHPNTNKFEGVKEICKHFD
ncbi:haloacid dehalogenase-like hydrolase, putative, partial [Plasmodium chabaudi adami]